MVCIGEQVHKWLVEDALLGTGLDLGVAGGCRRRCEERVLNHCCKDRPFAQGCSVLMCACMCTYVCVKGPSISWRDRPRHQRCCESWTQVNCTL